MNTEELYELFLGKIQDLEDRVSDLEIEVNNLQHDVRNLEIENNGS